MPQNTEDYNGMITKLQAAIDQPSPGRSSLEQMAQGIYGAATDDKAQLRYLLGDDAKQMYAMREENGDDAFMVSMRQRMFA